jgi:hypothetical protein
MSFLIEVYYRKKTLLVIRVLKSHSISRGGLAQINKGRF